jgi:hypothetical protein
VMSDACLQVEIQTIDMSVQCDQPKLIDVEWQTKLNVETCIPKWKNAEPVVVGNTHISQKIKKSQSRSYKDREKVVKINETNAPAELQNVCSIDLETYRDALAEEEFLDICQRLDLMMMD